MTPELSPFPIAVTNGCYLSQLDGVADQMKKTGVGYCIVRKEGVKPAREYVLWRAVLPKDKTNPEFIHIYEYGRTDGPKPGTKAWDGKIVEIYKP